MPKITLIGAGSVVFTRNLTSDILLTPALQDSTIALMDIDPQRLEIARALVQRLIDARGLGARVEATLDRRAALEHESAPAGAEKRMEISGRSRAERSAERLQDLLPRQPLPIYDAVRLLQLQDLLRGKTTAPKSDQIQPHNPRRHAVNGDVRRHVLVDVRLPANHAVAANAAELVDAHAARKVGVVPYGDVPGQHHVVRDDGVVAHLAVVRYVRVDHEQVLVANHRDTVRRHRTVDRHMLADHVPRTDPDLSPTRMTRDVLRAAAEHHVLVYLVAHAQRGALLDDYVGR